MREEEKRSATILQFPVGGRASLTGRNAARVAEAPVEAPTVMGGAWYHDEAIIRNDRVTRN
ncbi:MAG: DUF2735 domain-containing protein [Flavobacteriaceae bacterium]